MQEPPDPAQPDDAPSAQPRKRRRGPNVTTLLKQAQRAGVNLAGATVTVTVDGSASLTIGQGDGKPGVASNVNEWDAEYGGDSKAH